MTTLADGDLAQALRGRMSTNTSEVLVVMNGYQVSLFTRAGTAADWNAVGVGDLAEQSLDALTRLGSARLLGTTIDGPVSLANPNQCSLAPLNIAALKTWLKDRELLTKGRKGELTPKVQLEVASLAAWRCQMEGCGEDLREHLVGRKRANYGYFAHIVASSPSGPRGDVEESVKASTNEAGNVLLLCDKCHRLIDRVEPDSYGVERLRRMRERNIAQVNRLLSTLSFPSAHCIVIGGNIEGQTARFDQRSAERALWNRGLRQEGFEPLWFLRNGAQASDSTQEHYWHGLFDGLQTEIPTLRNRLTGNAVGGAVPNSIAVFPMHATSILVLAGRLIGDSNPVHIFQPNRDLQDPRSGSTWDWPNAAAEPTPDKYRLTATRSDQSLKEAALLVYLTANVPDVEIPWQAMSTVKITAQEPGHSVVAAQRDLHLLAEKYGEALRILQDQWRVDRIHLLVVAPASACVLLGQKLQARHHAPVTLYERKRIPANAARGPFTPTIAISPTAVSLVKTDRSVSLQ